MKNRLLGFTLIELMLVITLMAISVGVTSDILVTLVRSSNKTQVNNEIEQQSGFVTSKLEKELRNALKIITASGDVNVLVLKTIDGRTVTYTVDTTAGTISRTEVSADGLTSITLPLTVNATGGVKVSCPNGGKCFTISGVSPQIVSYQIQFDQAQIGAGASYKGSITLTNTVVIRNTYYSR